MNLRGLANRKLYHAAILLRMLAAELEREELPANVVLEAVGLAVREHLLEAYGWFLLELAGAEEPRGAPERGAPERGAPPCGVDALVREYGLAEPLRGELVELAQLERRGWLGELLAVPTAASTAARSGPDQLQVVEQGWSLQQLRAWHDGLADIIDRMAHGLDEW